jgi:ketosteroid isomerase-like protein
MRNRIAAPLAWPMICALALTTAAAGQTDIPSALLKMADAERAFAQRARDTTVSQAFIDFFADESVAFEPEPVPARESLRKRQAAAKPQPPGFQLLWEPRLGDVAASGDLGYLTGPAEYINPGRPNNYTTYFSVWKRQRDGEFRVILDIGIQTPEKTPFAAGFVRSPVTSAWKGTESRAQSEESLLAADRTFSAAIATKGPSAAFGEVMHPASRLNRNGLQPMTRTEAVAWLRREIKAMTSEPVKVETAAAGDLGYTWGRYTATSAASVETRGYYVRVWTRKADGSWQLASDIVTLPPRAA